MERAKPIDRPAGHGADWARFLGTWMRSPLKMGAVAASSPAYCDEMVRRSALHVDGPILELGAGLGDVTRALIRGGVAPSRITAVEYDRDFARALERRFPEVEIVCGDGLDLTRTLAGRPRPLFASVLLAIPIVRFPQEERRALLDHYFERIAPGGNLTQLSYMWTPPIRADPARYRVTASPFVWRNLPPARVWIYERANEAAGGAARP